MGIKIMFFSSIIVALLTLAFSSHMYSLLMFCQIFFSGKTESHIEDLSPYVLTSDGRTGIIFELIESHTVDKGIFVPSVLTAYD